MKVLITPLGVAYLTAGVINILVAAFTLLYALFPALIGIVAVDSALKQEEGAFAAMIAMFGTTAIVGLVGVVLGGLGIAYVVDGLGIIGRKSWARYLGLVLALPMMGICMPVGTLIGMLAFAILLVPDSAAEFGSQG